MPVICVLEPAIADRLDHVGPTGILHALPSVSATGDSLGEFGADVVVGGLPLAGRIVDALLDQVVHQLDLFRRAEEVVAEDRDLRGLRRVAQQACRGEAVSGCYKQALFDRGQLVPVSEIDPQLDRKLPLNGSLL